MSSDVENCLLEIIQQHGNKTAEEAKSYFENIKAAHRYHKDVY
jgi:sulfite reductase (NADPH) flavoprotein alpha-component